MKQGICLIAIGVMGLLGVYLVTELQKNGVVEAIEARRSIRAYKDTPVEREKLQFLAECGVKAPNAMGREEWEIRIVDSKEWIDKCTAAYMKAVEGTDKRKMLPRDDLAQHRGEIPLLKPLRISRHAHALRRSRAGASGRMGEPFYEAVENLAGRSTRKSERDDALRLGTGEYKLQKTRHQGKRLPCPGGSLYHSQGGVFAHEAPPSSHAESLAF